MGHDPFTPFHVVKVPRVSRSSRSPLASEEARWGVFFDAAIQCATRRVSGNAALDLMHSALCQVTEAEELWMRRVLKKHMAIGASEKTLNRVVPGLVPTFEVQLAQKFEEKRLQGRDSVFVEPKLDGIRCLAVVRGGGATLFARSGKLISNFDDTIGAQLVRLGEGCYDGELMGRDFISLMQQAYRKDDVDLSDTHFALFDYLPLEDWDDRKSTLGCAERYQVLETRLGQGFASLRLVPRETVAADYSRIKDLHDSYVSQGYEGAMVKCPSSPYRFGRGFEVMKLKAFHDVDLPIEGFIEGTGKHEGKLGSVIVSYQGTEVQVGSGFSDELREQIWANRDSFLGRVIECRYQEVTPDMSLRFPTFKCFRNDR